MSFRELPIQKPELVALYTKVGGEKQLRPILTEFYERMSKDLMIGFFFDGKPLAEIIEKQLEFMMRAMGAIPSYSGKPPADAHTQLAPILSGHFDRRLKILESVLSDAGLSVEDIRTWIGFENAFRGAVVTK